MIVKLRVAPTLESPFPCPFYREDNTGSNRCFFKLTTPVQVAMAVVEDNPNYNPDIFEQDCFGEWELCSFLPLLYKVTAEINEDTSHEPELVVANSAIADFDPFGIGDEIQDTDERVDAPTLHIPITAPQQVAVPEDIKHELSTVEKESIKVRDHTVKLWVTMVSNMYRFKTDVLVCPANGDLEIEDDKLFNMCHGNIQTELNRYPKPIQMGQIYVTSNGGDFENGVLASCLYHAVVSSPMRVVSEGDVSQCMNISLSRSDSRGAKSIAFIPADMGSVDINQMALIQLSNLYRATMTTNFRSLTDIYIVTEVDVDDYGNKSPITYNTYATYLRRVFKGAKFIESTTDTGEQYICAEIS